MRCANMGLRAFMGRVAGRRTSAGTVKKLSDGLLKSYIDRFAPGENAHDLSLDGWVTLCRRAHAMARCTSSL
jgi:hypothetical protein